MCQKLSYLLAFLLMITISSIGFALNKEDRVDFQKIFAEWTAAFNEKKFPVVCNLFSKSIIANYQGAPQKNYAMICDGFRKIFQEKETIYHNDFKIHAIYRSNDLAAVRITWYLTVYKKGIQISSIQEEGLDILRRQTNNKWQIVNFIAYPVLSTNK